ncbi:MAG: hypothetical protein M1819_005264 [Sarea resinae]|nr:MAG: hypothetical protein M1819_005264 [Sarea resinae]
MEGPVEEPAMLNVLSEKAVSQPIIPELLAYCPTMDLLAVATRDDQLNVYRLNGQRVFGATSKTPNVKINQVRWKPSGQLLAVTWADGTVRLISADTGKIVHHLGGSASSDSNITCLGWGLNFTDGKTIQTTLGGSANGLSLDDVLIQVAYAHAPKAELDLPRDLALLDIEGALPKLSVLPSGTKNDEIFSSRASMDSVFHSASNMPDNAVDALIVGLQSGKIHLTIYNSFEIGTFDLAQFEHFRDGSKPILHSSHPYSSTHALLVEGSSSTPSELFFVPLDLKFISSSGRYLSLLASKSTQLQNLLRYILEIEAQMESGWKSSQDLPNRFIRNVNESLSEKSQCDLVQAAYHLALTGNCFPAMKEWLVDELTERGHKRWEKAVIAGYEDIRRLVHENLLPALERCNVVVSRLRGLSRYRESALVTELSTLELNKVLDTIRCMNLLAHNIMAVAGMELRQFMAFSSWLRHEIDVQATDPASSSADEIAEKDAMIDYAKVLEYIQGALTKSKLGDFFNSWSSGNKDLGIPLGATTFYEDFRGNLQKHREGVDQKSFPPLDILSSHLKKQCDVIFEQIAHTETKNVLFGKPTYIETIHKTSRLDMRMCFENHSDGDFSVTYIAVTYSDYLYVYRFSLSIEDGISSTQVKERCRLHFPEGVLKDVKFVDDNYLMVAWCGSDISHLLTIPYSFTTNDPHRVCYDGTDGPDMAEFNPFDPNLLPHYLRHTFADSSGFAPERLEVNGRKGRRVVCVLGQDLLHYKVFDLDSNSNEEGGEDEEVVEGRETNRAFDGEIYDDVMSS